MTIMKKQSIVSLSLFCLLAFVMLDCGKKKEDPKPGTGTTTLPTITPGAKTLPVVKTPTTATEITSNSVKLTGVIDGNGGAPITEHRFGVNEAVTKENKQVSLGATSGPFPLTVTQTITGLKPGTKYNAYFIATNSLGGSQYDVSFTTTAAPQVTVSNLASDYIRHITTYSIELNGGSVNFQSGMTLNEYGYCYSDTKPDPTTADTKVISKSTSSGNIAYYGNSYLPGLKTNTAYYVRFYATVDGTTYYGDPLKISTEAPLSAATIMPKAEFPGLRLPSPISFVLGGKFYVGANLKSSTGSTSPELFYEYNPTTNAWTQKGNVTITGGAYKGGSSGLSYVANGKGYFGLSTSFTASKELWEYDPATDKWTRVATGLVNPLKQLAFIIHSSVQMGNKVYVIGSEIGNPTSIIRMYEFDITTRLFTVKITPPGTNSSFNDLVAVNNTLYYYNSLNQSLAEYNAGTNSWTAKNKLPQPSGKTGYVINELESVGGKLYGFGPEVLEYNPATDSWKVVLKVSIPDLIGGDGTMVFPFNDRLFMARDAKWNEFKP